MAAGTSFDSSGRDRLDATHRLERNSDRVDGMEERPATGGPVVKDSNGPRSGSAWRRVA